ncbi:MAG TPA: phosphopantetheine-binding protein [bacterium]|nr:phosphopantetheine-binding protein [bacterium]
MEIKVLIVGALRLEDVSPESIDSEALIFGGGLGLDSIDALELGVALQKKYGLKMTQDPQESKRHFANVRSLAAFVASQAPDQKNRS